MKNYINYYYNLNIYDLYFRNQKYFFKDDNYNYVFKQCANSNLTMYYYDLYRQLLDNPYFLFIVPNKDNNLVTVIDNKPYILLRTSNIINSVISIFDLKTDIHVKNIESLEIINHFHWAKLWERKIDYLEEFFLSKKERYKDIYPLFQYFIGISENALLYLKETEKNEEKQKNDVPVIQHNRIETNSTLYDYYDSTNVIVDHSTRDISEYIKSCVISGDWNLELFCEYLNKHNFSKYGLRIMYSRILFPSFFFDYMESAIMNNNKIDLAKLELKIKEYQFFLREITILLNEKYDVFPIEWIIKKT